MKKLATPKQAKLMLDMEKVKGKRDRYTEKYGQYRERLSKQLNKYVNTHVSGVSLVHDDGQDQLLEGQRWESTGVKYDTAALKKALKKDPELFASLLYDPAVDPAKVNQAFEAGRLSFEQLEPCSTAYITENISIKRVKRQKPKARKRVSVRTKSTGE